MVVEMAFHCLILRSKKLVCLHCIVSQDAVLCNTGSPYLSCFTGSDHWVAAVSQCFYLTGRNWKKKSGFFSGLASAFTEIAI